MKAIALCFFVAASASSLLAQTPLSGYDVFEVTTEAGAPSTAFEFKSILSGKLIQGMRAASPVLCASDLAKLDLTVREMGAAPCSCVSAVFLPAAAKKLRALAFRSKSNEVLIAVDGIPKTTFELEELIRLIDERESLFVFCEYNTDVDYLNAKKMIQRIKNGQWEAPSKPVASP